MTSDDQRPAGMGVAGLGEASLVVPLAWRVFRGNEAKGVQQLSRVIETGEVPQGGHRGPSHRELDTTQGPQGFDTGASRQVCPWSVSSYSRRSSRAVCSVTARTYSWKTIDCPG